MEKCQFAKDHLFNLNEIQRKTFEHFYKIKKAEDTLVAYYKPSRSIPDTYRNTKNV